MEVGECSSADNSRRLTKPSSFAQIEDYARGVVVSPPSPPNPKNRLTRLLLSIKPHQQRQRQPPPPRPPPPPSVTTTTICTTTSWCCCSCATCLILLILITLSIITLASTVFRPQRPEIKLDSIIIRDFDASVDLIGIPAPHLRLTVGANIAIYNPNTIGYFEYTNTYANLLYRGIQVGQAPISGGHIYAGERTSLNLTLILQGERFLADSRALVSDVSGGSLPLTTSAEVSGNLYLVLFEIKVFVRGYTSCNFSVGLVDRSVTNSLCTYEARF